MRKKLYRPQDSPKQRRFSFWWVVLPFAAAALIALYAGKPQEPPATQKPEHKRTLEELQAFWARELQTLIAEQLVKGSLPYPEINERFDILNKEIVRRTGKPLAINMTTEYHWAGKRIEASAGFVESNGTQTVELYMPAIVDSFEALQSSQKPKWRDAFTSHMIIIVMHEMEHTATTNHPKHFDIREESRAWADTCRYTVIPLVEMHYFPLFATDGSIYRAWKLADESTYNVHWLQAMQMLYGDLDGKTKL